LPNNRCRKLKFAAYIVSLAVLLCSFNHYGYLSKNLAATQGPNKTFLNSLSNIISLKKETATDITGIKVTPGGQSIGIMLHANGVIVVGMSDITIDSGNKVNPAEDAGIKVGDLITGVNGFTISNENELRNIIASYDTNQDDMLLHIKRGNKKIVIKIRPVTCKETGRPRIGIFVRDGTSGVGTLSFIDNETGLYGALGHIITDVDTNKSIDIKNGKIVEAEIKGIRKGKKGRPGEKLGLFVNKSLIDGTIEKNSRFGIFGKLNKHISSPYFREPIPVAAINQINKGPAEIFTVIEGTEVNKYTVDIQDIFYPWNNQEKGIIIKVTDQRLLDLTGGIIQGMSGSPVIQDGRLIAVVTHVFINDPTKGYGVPAEWMIRESGLIKSDNLKIAS